MFLSKHGTFLSDNIIVYLVQQNVVCFKCSGNPISVFVRNVSLGAYLTQIQICCEMKKDDFCTQNKGKFRCRTNYWLKH